MCVKGLILSPTLSKVSSTWISSLARSISFVEGEKTDSRLFTGTDKVLNALELPYSSAKLEATNNLIKVIKRNAFGFRNFENFKKRVLIALNSEKG